MTAASAAQSREVDALSNLIRLPIKAAAVPFQQTLAGLDSGGYLRGLVAGDPFMGFHRLGILAADAAVADGDFKAEVEFGYLIAKLPLTSVAQDDVVHKRQVFASDDNTFTFTPTATLIGTVVGVAGTNQAWVACIPTHLRTPAACSQGYEVLADAAATLTTAQCNKLLVITPGAGRTLTLPAAADWAGQFFTIKTLAAQVITVEGNAAETVDGAANFAGLDAANDVATFYSIGTAVLIVSAKIA